MLGFALFSLFAAAIAAPTSNRANLTENYAPGISFDNDKSGLPLLKLPYATYRAAKYDSNTDLYLFSNIRFAAPPVGDLRWRKPQPPLTYSGIQNGTVGNQCYQAETNELASEFFEALEPASEDCLFLDINVPGKALRGEAKNLPVLSWIYAGGYVFGSKSAFYYQHGAPLVKNSGNNLIYVAGNHRLGAFGFLNGGAVQTEGTPNAGYWDQRAIFQWIRDYIHLVNGDAYAVTAMGLSSGGSSLLHHLIAEHGQLDPLFDKAILFSPAFQPEYDPWILQNRYNDYETRLNCTGQGLTCLRSKTGAELQYASTQTVYSQPSGQFGFGPAVDGKYIMDLPATELLKGNYWKNLTSLLVTHTSHEGLIFADESVVTDSKYQKYMRKNLANLTDTTAAELYKLYPNKPNELTFNRLQTTIGHWAVNCNVRWLAKAYEGKTYSYKFSVPPGNHGEDTFFIFFDSSLGDSIDYHRAGIDPTVINSSGVWGAMQSYVTSFVRTGNPNTYKSTKSKVKALDLPMPVVNASGLEMMNIKFGEMYMELDDETPKEHCDWWQSGVWTNTPAQESGNSTGVGNNTTY